MSEIQAKIVQDHIVLRTPYEYRDVCKSVPGARWHKDWKCWYWPARAEAARGLLDAFGPKLRSASGVSSLIAIVEEDQRRQANKGALVSEAVAATLGDIPGLKGSSWLHQRAAYAFARDLPGAMLALEMGLGKSRTAVGLIVNRSRRVLILCPKSVVPVWPREFVKHAAVDVHVEPLLKGTVAAKRAQAEKALALAQARRQICVIVLNYESAWREEFAKWALDKAAFDTLVLDEAHKIKSPGGKASRFCGNMAKRAAWRIGLTGTPMPHSPLDIYGIYRAIDVGVFGSSFNRFKQRYAITGGFQGREVVGYQRKDELQKLFEAIAFKAGKECLELPPEQDITIPVDIGPKARRIAKQLEGDLYAAIGSGEITAANALVKLLRLQQCTSGWIKLDDGTMEEVDTGKRDALSDLLEGVGKEPVVVFTRFTTDLNNVKSVAEEQGLRYAELSGRMNNLAMWQDGGADVLGVNIQAGGAGIDLTRSRYCVYYSVGFSLGDYMQSRARVHRPGQDRPVTYYHLLAQGTVDEKVYEALSKRQEVVDSIIGQKK